MGFEINLHPSYSRAVLDIIRHYGWEKVYYLYEGEEGKSLIFVVIYVVQLVLRLILGVRIRAELF